MMEVIVNYKVRWYEPTLPPEEEGHDQIVG